jgi:hypothetical protein
VDGDNNIRPDVGADGEAEISGWYAYQRKDDPALAAADPVQSPEAAQLVAGRRS